MSGDIFILKMRAKTRYTFPSITGLGNPKQKEEIAAVREMIVNTSKQSLYKTLQAFYKRKETCSKLHDISVPVLIVVGKEDKITPLEAAQMMHEKIEDSVLYIIEHAAHLSNIENPFDFNNQLEEFFSTVYYNG